MHFWQSIKIAFCKCKICKHAKDNLCRNERQAVFRLKSDKSIVIKEADKGNAVVILDREYYSSIAFEITSLLCAFGNP
jgi:Zn-dependent alcohol dehydrogenase